MDGGLWCGERECLDLLAERERKPGGQDRQGHSFNASFTPRIHRMEPPTHMCEGVMVGGRVRINMRE